MEVESRDGNNGNTAETAVMGTKVTVIPQK